MAKHIVVAGFGPGISKAVAEQFGKQGFAVSLIARNGDRLAAGVKALTAAGIKAQAFNADLSNPDAARDVMKKIHGAMGPISVLQWTAYSSGAGDLTKASNAEMRASLEISTTSLAAAIQEALPDLRAEKGAVLVTNGGLGYFDASVDLQGVQWGAMGLSMANAAKHKLVRLFNAKLKGEGVYVGEVMVTGAVKGTVFDQGSANIEASAVAKLFWDIYQARAEVSTRI